MAESFRWRDGERIVRFGRGALADAPDLLGDGYVLLTTPRAAGSAPAVVEAAAERHDVPRGPVDEIAGDLLARLGHRDGALLVALGGGRVIDVAKAVCAAGVGRAVAAVPTTLSAAEMTRSHRSARGVVATPPVRPQIVLNDPALSASQPDAGLAASAANALAHAVEAAMTVRTSPVPRLAAHDAARRIAIAWGTREIDRDELALGALLSGYALDATGYGLHHVAAQTLVREGGVPHGAANAVLLPHTIAALRDRNPEAMAALEDAIGDDPAAVAADLARRAGAERIRDLGVPADRLDAIAQAAAARADQLANTPPPADAHELREIYTRAW